jgi:hypothetical protein
MAIAKKEASFDRFIDRMLNNENITATAQGSQNVEIDNVLKSASKNQEGNVGFSNSAAIIKDFVLVLENKPDVRFLADYEGTAVGRELVMVPHATKNYALNGALFYANPIVENTSLKKVFAFGIAGNETYYATKPLFVGEHISMNLPELQTFANFSENNIENNYNCYVLGEKQLRDIQLDDILKKSKILLALCELKLRGFRLDQLRGDTMQTDGEVLFTNLENSLKIANIGRDVKLRQVLDQFTLIKNRPSLNEIHPKLDKTPLKYISEYINKNIYII